MAYKYCYQLQSAPGSTDDGADIVTHMITALYMDESEADWELFGIPVPGNTNKQFNLPTDDVEVVMAMPAGTGSERAAKNRAYKNLMVANINTLPTPLVGWTETEMNTKILNNEASEAAASDVDEYITVTLGQAYPIEFQLDI